MYLESRRNSLFTPTPHVPVSGLPGPLPPSWSGPVTVLDAPAPVVRVAQLEGLASPPSQSTAGGYVSALLRATIRQAVGFASDEPDVRLEQAAPGVWLASFPAAVTAEAVGYAVRDLAATLRATVTERERGGLTLAWPLAVGGLSAAVFGRPARAIELDLVCDPARGGGVTVRAASRLPARPTPAEIAAADRLMPGVIRRIRAAVRGPERRAAARFPVARPVAVYPVELSTRWVYRPSLGVSADVSQTGVRVVTDSASPCRFVYVRFPDVEGVGGHAVLVRLARQEVVGPWTELAGGFLYSFAAQ